MRAKKKTKISAWEIEAAQSLRKRIFDLEQNLLRTEREKQALYLDMERHRELWVREQKRAQTYLDRIESTSLTAQRIWIRIGKFLRIIDSEDTWQP